MDRSDITSDPAHSDEEGHDWSDEGGALSAGPATDPEDEPDEVEPDAERGTEETGEDPDER